MVNDIMRKAIRSFTELGSLKVEGRRIEGYAAVFDQESKVMYDEANRRPFIEIIERGAITEEMLLKCDVKAVLEHNAERMLARWTYGGGTLTLSVDDYGLKYAFEAPDTPDGNYAAVMIARGDIRGSSFIFYTNEKDPSCVSYSRKNGMLVRRVHKILAITDVSPVSEPAYFGTDVSVRNLQLEGLLDETDEDYLEQINNLEKLI